ncbi:MAG: hypothetical protein AAF570_10735, partial [Bacteroidota bacterium]
VFTDRDGRYFYYPHGPLARIELGEDNVQGMDYFYSIHGWIKGMNMVGTDVGPRDPGMDGDVSGVENGFFGRDAACFQLGFYEGDYQPIGNPNLGVAALAWDPNSMGQEILSTQSNEVGLFNGNIAWMITDIPGDLLQNLLPGSHGYAYKYDQLNRIKEARSFKRNPQFFPLLWQRLPNGTGLWDTDYAYDKNGNLEQLTRRIPDPNAPAGLQSLQSARMDEFSYNYDLSSGEKLDNKLRSVNDTRPAGLMSVDIDDQPQNNYQYDEIGNLTQDQSENIAQITWDLYNKVQTVQRNPTGVAALQPDLHFEYDGMGNRIFKRVIQPTQNGGQDTTDTWYVRDPQGNPMAIYTQKRENDTLYTYVSEYPIYGAKRLGQCRANQLIRKECYANCVAQPGSDPVERQGALVITEVFYDSPKTSDGAAPGVEVHDGEYVRVLNASDEKISLEGVELGDVPLSGALEAGQELLVANTMDWGDFAEYTAVPAEILNGAQAVASVALELDDCGGDVVLKKGGVVLDEIEYGPRSGRVAENAYLEGAQVDSVHLRSSLTSVQRLSVGVGSGSGVVVIGPVWSEVEPEVEFGVLGAELKRGGKAYEVANHLGNVLAVISDLKLGQADPNISGNPFQAYPPTSHFYKPQIEQLTDYYPFGMPLPGRQYTVSENYRYGFQGQEGDDEWNGKGASLAFKYRIHEARLGRFFSVDPLAPDYPFNSTYAFSENQVINAVELEGLEKEYITSTGESAYGPFTDRYAGKKGWQSPVELEGITLTPEDGPGLDAGIETIRTDIKVTNLGLGVAGVNATLGEAMAGASIENTFGKVGDVSKIGRGEEIVSGRNWVFGGRSTSSVQGGKIVLAPRPIVYINKETGAVTSNFGEVSRDII